MQYTSNCYNDTFEFGKEFSKTLTKGDVVILNGDLGAGKTAFTAGVAAGLGITDYVSSPTFTIVNEYRNGKTPVFHFDLYRLTGEDDLYDIGVEEYLSNDGICIFEWPEFAKSLLDSYYTVEIQKDLSVSEDYRKIIITKSGNKNEHISD
ncbi:MAG: tRNA (adenosine(37)-N6)-threonylcarbamoyltransferase complex ATPase subunit type 1 TsaE [Ruminococcaceae bacterium]|nr:tRNA (adenosine(37)-N6)-threonylcarbamoyltransferase complex ATPase subunit type 1 TsaE [Oscillospiraceae bacterium]